MRSSWKRQELRLAITRRGLSGEQFALVAGISPETLRRLFRGRDTNSATTLAILAALARLPEVVGADLVEAATKKAIPPRTAFEEAVGVGGELRTTA